MDSNVSMIPIQHEFKFSEKVIKRLSTKVPGSPIPSECISGLTDIKEIPDMKYGMYLDIITKNNVSYFSPMFRFYNLQPRCIRGTFAFYIKSANYASTFESDLFESDFWEMDGSFSPGSGPDVCTVEDLFNPEKNFIVNGECCIEMKGIFHLESSIETCEPQKTLAQYLWNRDDHDFTIVVGQENKSKTEIKVHKLILAARSPVFDAMLQTNMKEKAENKVAIIDFDVQTVKNAIAFCYDQNHGNSFNDIAEATSLFQFADKYDIQDLKNELEQFLETDAVPDTICQIANASVISNSPKLREICIEKMIMFSKMEIPIDNIEILDKDITLELMKKTFSSKK